MIAMTRRGTNTEKKKRNLSPFLPYLPQVRGELSLLAVLRDPMLQKLFAEWLEKDSAEDLLEVRKE